MENVARKFEANSNAPSMTGADILSNIRAMRAALQERSEDIEELRQLPNDIQQLLRDSGVFRMTMPHAWGGPEMTPMQINEALEELSMGNAAVAWCAMIQMDVGLYSAYFEDSIARSMFDTLDCPMSNVLRASGRARKVDGGYVVNGTWSFASGCTHADWFAGGCIVVNDDDQAELGSDGEPIFRMIVARREAFVIHDTWYTTGLRGTGSNDIEASNLFIPITHSFSFDNRPREGALYSWPAMLCAKMPGVVFGIVRSALETVTQAMRGRDQISPDIALAVADAQTLFASARAYVYNSLEALWTRLSAGETPTEQERIDIVLARANAFQAGRRAVQLMFDALGTSSIYQKKSPLDRHLRDMQTACQHVMAQRKGQLAAGAFALGVSNSSFPFL